MIKTKTETIIELQWKAFQKTFYIKKIYHHITCLIIQFPKHRNAIFQNETIILI